MSSFSLSFLEPQKTQRKREIDRERETEGRVGERKRERERLPDEYKHTRM
jgi:hypothetical protein